MTRRYAHASYFVCKRCGKTLSAADSDHASLISVNTSICITCHFFNTIGVITTEDYHRWLAGENWLRKSK